MKHYAIGTFIGLIGLTSALAQNGDRKDHNKMGKIVPEKLIPPAYFNTIFELNRILCRIIFFIFS